MLCKLNIRSLIKKTFSITKFESKLILSDMGTFITVISKINYPQIFELKVGEFALVPNHVSGAPTVKHPFILTLLDIHSSNRFDVLLLIMCWV